MQFADCEYGSAQYFFLVSDNTIKNKKWYFKEYNVRSQQQKNFKSYTAM